MSVEIREKAEEKKWMCKKNQIWLRVGLKNEAIIWFVNSVQFTLIADWQRLKLAIWFLKKLVLWYHFYSKGSKIYKYVTQFQSLRKACKKTYPSYSKFIQVYPPQVTVSMIVA